MYNSIPKNVSSDSILLKENPLSPVAYSDKATIMSAFCQESLSLLKHSLYVESLSADLLPHLLSIPSCHCKPVLRRSPITAITLLAVSISAFLRGHCFHQQVFSFISLEYHPSFSFLLFTSTPFLGSYPTSSCFHMHR